MDTESPVVWPSWCYSGDPVAVTVTSPTAADQRLASPLTADPPKITPTNPRKRRIDRTHSSLLSSSTSPSALDFVLHNNNNNVPSVKNERVSPVGTPDTSSRSRSVTPSSSHPDTPPAPTDNNQNQHHPLFARNYSDFMRSLAAKYNNANPNDFFTSHSRNNGFPPPLDSRFKPHPFPALFPSLHPSPQSKDATIGELSNKKNERTEFSGSGGVNPFATTSIQAPSSLFPPLIDMSTTQTLLALMRTAKEAELQDLLKAVKRTDPASPLDLSASAGSVTPNIKKRKLEVKHLIGNQNNLLVPFKRSQSESPVLHEDLANWSVDDVYNFVAGIDICAEYAETFRQQRIDGAGLPLLTEEHLTGAMGMRLGPALKLRSLLARRTGSCGVCLHCSHCHAGTSGFGSPAGSQEGQGNVQDDRASSSH